MRHSAPSDIADLCIQQCVSRVVSCPRNVVLQGSFHSREDILMHDEGAKAAAVVASTLVVVDLHDMVCERLWPHSAQQKEQLHYLLAPDPQLNLRSLPMDSSQMARVLSQLQVACLQVQVQGVQ
jgi:hypothetical protein